MSEVFCLSIGTVNSGFAITVSLTMILLPTGFVNVHAVMYHNYERNYGEIVMYMIHSNND